MTDHEIARRFRNGQSVSTIAMLGVLLNGEVEDAIRRALLRAEKRKQPKRSRR